MLDGLQYGHPKELMIGCRHHDICCIQNGKIISFLLNESPIDYFVAQFNLRLLKDWWDLPELLPFNKNK